MKVLANGQLIEYVDQGEGKVIVLLHGWGANLHTFDDVAARLTKSYRVIRIDFPGFGTSSLPPSDWTILDFATTVAVTLKKLDVDSVHALVGHSFGGRVIIKLIAQQLTSPKKVILLDAAGVKPPRSVKKSLYKAVAKTGKVVTALPGLGKVRENLRKKLYESAGSTDYLNAGQLQKVFLNTINEDLLPEVHNITQPTLLLWGEKDTDTPVSDAEKMTKELADARLVVYPNAGHFVYQDEFESVMSEMERFL